MGTVAARAASRTWGVSLHSFEDLDSGPTSHHLDRFSVPESVVIDLLECECLS